MIVLILRQFVYQPLYTIDSSSYLCCFPFYSKRQQNEKKGKIRQKKNQNSICMLRLFILIYFINSHANFEFWYCTDYVNCIMCCIVIFFIFFLLIRLFLNKQQCGKRESRQKKIKIKKSQDKKNQDKKNQTCEAVNTQ